MILYRYPAAATVSVSVPPLQIEVDGVPTTVNVDTGNPANTVAVPVTVVGTPAPISFQRDGSSQTVTEDTVTPTNNRPLPSGMFFSKEGVFVPVSDSATPSQVAAVPVKIMTAGGENINITAGDLNVLISDMGPSFSSLRLGDGSGNYVGVNADTEALVYDEDANTTLTSIDGKTPVLVGGKVPVDTGLTQPLTNTELRATPVPVSGTISTGGLTDAELRASAVEVADVANGVLIGAVNETAPATDTASSGLNGRLQRIAQRLTSLIGLLPASLGQKTSANSLAVVPSNDYVPPAPAVPAALTVKNKAVAFGTSAVRLTHDGAAPSVTRRKLQFIIEPPVGDVNYFLGASTVQNSGSDRGIRLYPGTLYTYENDAADYYIISDTAAQTVFIVEQE